MCAMIGSDEPPEQAGAAPSHESSLAGWREQVRPAVVGLLVLTLVTGVVFPLVLLAVAHVLFPHQANGSLARRHGTVVGTEWIGQDFNGPGYFQPRPSAAGDGYDPRSSGGSNLGPDNPRLRQAVGRRAVEFRRRNGLPADALVPVDAVTASGSGLDPHISPANAELQVGRVARVRGLSEDAVRRLVAEHTSGRQLGLLGEPRVAVLRLNRALDRLAQPGR
jgi:K+-transporting ATPase ATPase C chain